MTAVHYRIQGTERLLCDSKGDRSDTLLENAVTCDRCLAMLSLRHGGEGTLAGAVDTLTKELREQLKLERFRLSQVESLATERGHVAMVLFDPGMSAAYRAVGTLRHRALSAEGALANEKKALALRDDEVAALRADFDRKLEAQMETVKALEASLEAQRAMTREAESRASGSGHGTLEELRKLVIRANPWVKQPVLGACATGLEAKQWLRDAHPAVKASSQFTGSVFESQHDASLYLSAQSAFEKDRADALAEIAKRARNPRTFYCDTDRPRDTPAEIAFVAPRFCRYEDGSFSFAGPSELKEELRIAGELLKHAEEQRAREEAAYIESLRTLRRDRDDARKERDAIVRERCAEDAAKCEALKKLGVAEALAARNAASLASEKERTALLIDQRRRMSDELNQALNRIENMRAFASAWSKDK